MKVSSKTSVRSRTIDKDSEFNQWVTFNINNELFAVDALQVREVLKYSEITPVPNSNAYVCGLINLRGKVVTVIDTRLMFTLPHKAPDDKTNIILVDFNEEEMVGFVVDTVGEVVNILIKSIEIAPKLTDNDTKRGFVKGVSYYNNTLIILLEIKKIISYISPALEDDPL
ncbi:MAG: chemotaxis protein CheW [Oceanospirillaceae bacterium]|nr:chemotaxis protein CheW [Oceanospirillaceae bacterium]